MIYQPNRLPHDDVEQRGQDLHFDVLEAQLRPTARRTRGRIVGTYTYDGHLATTAVAASLDGRSEQLSESARYGGVPADWARLAGGALRLHPLLEAAAVEVVAALERERLGAKQRVEADGAQRPLARLVACRRR